jgi:hypothetical protein
MLVHWLLIASLALGAPVASCCQWGAIARSAVGAFAAAPANDSCCCAPAPADDDRAPCDNDGSRCTCGPSKSLFAEGGGDRLASPVAVVAPVCIGPAGAALTELMSAPAVGRGGLRPVLSLLRQHCALTI